MDENLIIEILELGSFFVNCYIVGDKKSRAGIIIDPADDADSIENFVKKHELKIEQIVITHGHADHIGALDEARRLFKAPVSIGEKDAPMLTNPALNLSGSEGLNIIAEPAEKILREGDIVSVGQFNFKVLDTPGHTAGSISLFGHGVVFTGDALFLGSIGRTDFPGSSHEQLVESIKRKLLTLPEDTIVFPGHGPDSSIGQERDFNPFLE
jgi:hydroxyacylglutathione hydrolase